MVDPEVLGGTPVFKGTRVPVATLFDYLEDDYSLEEFLECFPTVSREAFSGFECASGRQRFCARDIAREIFRMAGAKQVAPDGDPLRRGRGAAKFARISCD